MTLYLVFERMEAGFLKSNTKIKMSANAAAAPPSKLGLEEGEDIALIDAIKVLITKSANDVAVAVAEHIAGSEEKFARLMTQKARQLGMTATVFRNASGLPDDEQVTTARDMVTLALHLQDDFPRQYPLFATRKFTYKDETFRNHNTLLFNYPGTDGLKTGYTRASGFNLAASVRRGRKHVIAVVFGGTTAARRNAAMRRYLSRGLAKASSVKTRKPAPRVPLIVRARPSPAARIADAPAPRPATSASPVVVMARVRPVLVGPDGMAGSGTVPHPNSIEALLKKEPGGGQVPPPQRAQRPHRWVAAGTGTSSREASDGFSGRSALGMTRFEGPGSPPSTLSAQAANLARREAATASPERTASASATVGGFQVQVGAYQSADEAQRQLALVAKRASSLVDGHAAVTQQVKLDGKLYYRARYVGFDAHAAAAHACTELKRLEVDCFVHKAD